MRRTFALLAAATIGLAVNQAWAADLPTKAPAYVPPPPPPVTWTGCYIGGNIGGAFGQFSVDTPFGGVSQNGSGFAGGGQIGCDYQFTGGWVFGIRDNFDWTSNNKSRTFTVAGLPAVADFHNQWFDTLTGRIGYAFQPNWLAYFQGGAAWGHTSTALTVNGIGTGSNSNTRTGWTIGGGFEWMFMPHWSAFLEGNYMNFGSRDGTFFSGAATVCAAGCSWSAKATEANVLVGVNYRFF
ncbi:MAG TPA: outer membrane beta-barrel protein [Pseudolabrys sp.]|jgi:outer membrane immunogenic protein